jgi:filamentous hemagglutinin
VNIGENLEQIGRGLTDNILVRAIKDAATDSETNLLEAMKGYMSTDKTMTQIQANKELTESLNGLTNYDAQGVKDVLQDTVNIAGENGGFVGEVELFNEGIENKGYAYQDSDGQNKTIGINTNKTDLTNSGGVMNNVWHETTDFEAHNANEQTAINRGNTAEAIWELKNFGNANTNTMTSLQWNANNAGSSVFTTGNTGAITNAVNNYFGIGTMNAAGGNVNT